MVDESSKVSLKLLVQKSETSNRNTKSRLLYKSGFNYKKTKTEVPTSRMISSHSASADPVGKNDGSDFENQSKTKFLDVIPRNSSKETSEGVQEFIKHVSRYIERKTPLVGQTGCSYSDGGNTDSPRYKSIQFNGLTRKSDEKNKAQESKLEKNWAEDENKKQKTIRPVKLNSVSPLKKDSIGGRGKISKVSVKKTEEVDKKYKKDLSGNKKIQHQTAKNVTADSNMGDENESPDSSPMKNTPREGASDGPVQTKKRRPSEIPLRKVRTNSYKKPKFVSVLKRPLKQVESVASIGFNSKSKSFLPIEELNDYPGLQVIIKVDFDSEKDIEGGKIGLQDEEMQESIKLGRCIKSPNIPDVIKSSTSNILEEKPSGGKKLNAIDLNKVKTSSFTVLRTSSTVLDRLESLHKQNVLSKEKLAGGKTPSKSKFLTSKTSINSLKEKNMKRSSFSRLGIKGNKSGLKLKKKSKKETNQEPSLGKKRPKPESEEPCVKDTTALKVLRTPNVERSPRTQKTENITNESLKANLESRKKEECTLRKIILCREKSALKASNVPEEFKSSDPVISGVEYFESQNLEKPKSGATTPVSKISSKQSLSTSTGDEKTETGQDSEKNDPSTEIPTNPPPTPEGGFAQVEQLLSEEWSSKTVIFDEKFNSENYSWYTAEQAKTETDAETVAEGNEETVKHPDLFLKGTLLNFCKGELCEKLELYGAKKQLRIDLNTHEDSTDDERVEENEEIKPTVDTLSTTTDIKEGKAHEKDRLKDRVEKVGSTEGRRKSKNVSGDTVSSEVTDEPGSFSQAIQKPLLSRSPTKRKEQCKSGGSVKGMRKKKIRSDAGDRPSPSDGALFNSDPSAQSKTKLDAKMRSGLTKSSKWEERMDLFDEATAIKLKRRNSEPNSFRGYVWKCADAATPRGHRTSVSSMTSSLRHLNTDDIDDFIFWEAVPQKMTSCWEMSLYHFKRPWSVLSCSVFRDNRLSSTPGLILENLRNGGTLNTRRSAVNQSERATNRKENPFDVEPSIAQKNIDIRNWLAALNFPTFPSTSTDAFSEGNFATQFSVDSQNMNKVNPKRRKVLPNIKFSDEVTKKKAEEKEKFRSPKWDSGEDEGLTELIRRKSGGFVTKEQYLNSEHSVHRPNVTVNFCVYSKSAEESILVEASDRNSVCEPRKYKSVEVATQPDVSISATIINSGAVVGDQLIEKIKTKEKPQESQKEEKTGNGFFKGDVIPLRSDVNIWKYLFLLTIFLIIIHYCIISSFLGHN